MSPDIINRAADLIEDADALIVAAGAGMGVDSGLPDFRGPEGFWRAYPALGKRGLEFYSVASPRTFETEPALAWGFYGHRLKLYRDTTPHAGFGILRTWGERMFHGYGVFTSNVDGHFARAGFDANLLAECHGSIHHLQCSRSCSPTIWPADGFEPVVHTENCLLLNEPPRCPNCGALARPNILMFGDASWLESRSLQQEAALRNWVDGVQRLVVVELGAGTAIPSVRHFTHRLITHHGARLVRINPREPSVPTPADVSMPGAALASLAAIETNLRGRG
jgi:NAD-dependent SIR2 family protein deacetylase